MQWKSLQALTPGLTHLLGYQRSWLKPDIRAGLSVAAVALPVAIAYAELAGVSPVVGLYSCILPMVAYALFGSSRQLIVGPDAATCAVIAAVVTPLAAGNMERHWQLTIMMTAMMGGWCLLASRFKLGALADLLSRPILSGLLNGVAITIMVDQIGKVLGFTVRPAQLIERIYALPGNLLHSDWLTMAVSLLTLVTLLGFKNGGLTGRRRCCHRAGGVRHLGRRPAAAWRGDGGRFQRRVADRPVAGLPARLAARHGDPGA